jgi:signal transduction histidine kinase/CheY-like chemotaxis protein
MLRGVELTNVGSHDTPEAERARLAEAVRHHRILSDVSRALLDYVGPDEVEPLRRIVRLVTEALGDWCAFSLVEADGTLRSVVAHHPDPRQRELEKAINEFFPPRRWDAGVPELNALVQNRPIVVEHVTPEMLRAASPNQGAFEKIMEFGLTSAITAPMADGDQPLGTMTLASVGPGGRKYSQSDIDFVFSLAGRAALAVRNARLVKQISEERDRQKQARLDADRHAAELRAFFASDPNGVALFDAGGKLQLASIRLEEIFGIPLRSMLGQPWEDIYSRKLALFAGDLERHFRRVAELFDDRSSRGTDVLELEKPRHRWITRTTVPVRGPEDEYLGRLFVYVDVTEQREMDRQRSDFLTVAAHELRTPLTPLSMYLQSIERKLQRQQTPDPELVGKARRQVGRLSRLVEDLLDVSRLESRRMDLSRERIVLDELVDQVVGDFRSASRMHDIVFHRPQTRALVEGDRARLEQVLVNLLGNAVKYSPQGGQIQVKLEKRAREVCVSVSDPGIGIPLEEHSRVFERFFRARNAATRNYGGLGIGLFVSNEIVVRHGGHFAVKSEPGIGSVFTFFLPLADGQEQAGEGKARILLVDDDPEILEATGQLLREWGYTVDEARDGVTALALARGARPDLMLVDLMMPVMDGWTLIARLREDKVAPGVPLVVFSADRDSREKADSLRADAALRKPFALEELQEVVERLLARARPSAPLAG